MSDSATQFYIQLAEFYEELFPADPHTIDLMEQEARQACRHEDPAPRVLDAGCGTGIHLRELLRRGLDGWGLDLSIEMIEVAIRHDPAHGHRYRAADMETVSTHPAGPFHLVYTLGNTISHLPSHGDAFRWIETAASALTSNGALVVQFMDVSHLQVGESIDLPRLTGTAARGEVSLERRYTRQSATTLRFDAVLRRPDPTQSRSISNTLLVLATDEVTRVMETAGFAEIIANSSSWSRTVCAKLKAT